MTNDPRLAPEELYNMIKDEINKSMFTGPKTPENLQRWSALVATGIMIRLGVPFDQNKFDLLKGTAMGMMKDLKEQWHPIN